MASCGAQFLLYSNAERCLWMFKGFSPKFLFSPIHQEVEKTVDHLESEVKSLLSTVSETAWNVPLAPGTPLLDIFEDPS
ncbi:UNVERIFIED_CONTAM: hypothetical protein K2H54_007855 [Gekko kuhli]